MADHSPGLIPEQDLPDGQAHTNGVPSRNDGAQQLTMHGKEAGKPVENGTEVDEHTASQERAQRNHVRPISDSMDVISNTEARLEVLAQERAALKDQVSDLRRSLEEVQMKHQEGMSIVRTQLNERNSEKEHAETQYRKLLGKVNTIRSQLGERLKADAVGAV